MIGQQRSAANNRVIPYRGLPAESQLVSPVADETDGCCIVCMKTKDTVGFQCGHSACLTCASLLSTCPSCQTTFTRKTEHAPPPVGIPSRDPQISQNGRPSFESYALSSKEKARNSNQCNICLERKISVHFTCGHAACSECATQLSICPFCQQNISTQSERGESSTRSVKSSAERRLNSPKRASSCCILCLMNNNAVDFQCGHAACSSCASLLSICPTCQQPITSRVEHDTEDLINTFTECMVCCKFSTKNYCILKPCNHTPACEDCSAEMKECLICDQVIDRRLATDGRVVPHRDSEQPPPYSLEEDTEEASSRCVVCVRKKNTVDFQCGHSACPACADHLDICPSCQKTITSKTRHDDSDSASVSLNSYPCELLATESTNQHLGYEANRNSIQKPCGHRPDITPGSSMVQCQLCENAIDQLILIDVDDGPYDKSHPKTEDSNIGDFNSSETQLSKKSIFDDVEHKEDSTSVLKPLKQGTLIESDLAGVTDYLNTEEVTDDAVQPEASEESSSQSSNKSDLKPQTNILEDQTMQTGDITSPSFLVCMEGSGQSLYTSPLIRPEHSVEDNNAVDFEILDWPSSLTSPDNRVYSRRKTPQNGVIGIVTTPGVQFGGPVDEIPKSPSCWSRLKRFFHCTIL